MHDLDSSALMNRRRALAMGASVGGLTATGTLGTEAFAAQTSNLVGPSPLWQGTIDRIEQIIQAQGMLANGVFSIGIDRDDLTNVRIGNVPILPAFEVNGALVFQDLGSGRVAMNSDMALKGSEINAFIDQLLLHDIVFQAEHQHFYDFNPPVWFIHFRAVGDPIQLARGVKAALNVTSTPFPQKSPSNPKSPLPTQQIGKILGGSPTIGANGVVTVDVPREDPIILGGTRINPFLNVQTTVSFEPYGGGQNAAAAPDFGMISREIQNVLEVMRRQGWDIGCLYNQETDEQPQLYFSHQFKTGDAIQLAREIRQGLNRMDVRFMS